MRSVRQAEVLAFLCCAAGRQRVLVRERVLSKPRLDRYRCLLAGSAAASGRSVLLIGSLVAGFPFLRACLSVPTLVSAGHHTTPAVAHPSDPTRHLLAVEGRPREGTRKVPWDKHHDRRCPGPGRLPGGGTATLSVRDVQQVRALTGRGEAGQARPVRGRDDPLEKRKALPSALLGRQAGKPGDLEGSEDREVRGSELRNTPTTVLAGGSPW